MSAMAPDARGETQIHVAQLLQEPVGATRQAAVALDALPLDDELTARAVAATARLTRIPAGILAKGRATATVRLTCSRCLEETDAPLAAEFADEYRPTIDIATGAEIAPGATDEDDESFPIGDTHLLDLRDSLRQALLLEVPMAPVCREDCPGLPEAADLGVGGDARLAVLGRLLTGEAGDERE